MTQAWDFVDATILWQAGNSILNEDPKHILEIGTRARNMLRNEKINTVRELVARSAWELLRVPDFGRVSLIELEGALQAHGLNLRDPHA
jgi:DNA-directed RNA polymerase alpha subunit